MGTTDDEDEISPQLIATGLYVLAKQRARGADNRELIASLWTALSLPRNHNVSAFARETIFNIRGALEALGRCEKRATEHLRTLDVG